MLGKITYGKVIVNKLYQKVEKHAAKKENINDKSLKNQNALELIY